MTVKYFFLVISIVLIACTGIAFFQHSPTPPTSIKPERTQEVIQEVKSEQSISQPPSAVSEETETDNISENRAIEKDLPLAARVNGQPIFLDVYEQKVTQFEQSLQNQDENLNYEADPEIPVQVKQQILENLINQLIIEQQAYNLGLTITEEAVETIAQENINREQDHFDDWLAKNGLNYEQFKKTLHTQLIANQVFEYITSQVPTITEQIQIRHILVADEATGQIIIEQLKNGIDFSILAQEYSLDEASRANGGDLGWLPQRPGLIPPELEILESVAFALQPGEISNLIQTPLGFHVIKLENRDPARPLTNQMLQILKRQIFMDWLVNEQSSTNIERYIDFEQ